MKRKVIQICYHAGRVIVLCADGTIWRQILVSPDGDTKWQQITGPPAGAQDGNA